MPSLKVTVSLPQLDRERFLNDLRSATYQAVIKAARKFLLAAIPHIPIFTGFARGALGNLEDIAGRVQGGQVRTTLKGVTKEKRSGNWYYYPSSGERILRTNISGRQFATPPQAILTRTTTNSRLIFKFSVDINYFNYLDEHKWHAFEAGKQAFDAELKLQLQRLMPDIGKYFIRRGFKYGS